jgi:pimeloyl-ACP methyl ester carboxylesterase
MDIAQACRIVFSTPTPPHQKPGNADPAGYPNQGKLNAALPMGQIFKDQQLNEFGCWALGYLPYGGADFGEIVAVADEVGEGDASAFHAAWVSAGDRLAADAETALADGHQESARELFLRASCFYGLSYRPLYGEPVDPRLTAAFQAQIRAFDRGLGLFAPPVTPLRIPFEGTTLPAYLVPATGHESERRPLLILTNGFDSSVTDSYFASAVAASRRGYHCLIFDGPGQGEMLILQDIRLRPDWETVIRSVVDFALTLPNVDPKRMALSGWSLGGYLAVRAASGEHRLAACIADPGLFSMSAGFGKFLSALNLPASARTNLGDLDEGVLTKVSAMIGANPRLTWSIFRRGYWVQGVRTLRDCLKSVDTFTLDGRIDLVQCPTLLTMAEHDSLSESATEVYAALRCPKTLIRFTAAEGAGEHCEMQNRSLLNRRVLDWLDSALPR